MLLHHPSHTDPADAVFWIEDGKLKSYIPTETEETRLAMLTVFSKTPEATWESLFDFLDSRTLTRDKWIALEASDPRETFEALR